MPFSRLYAQTNARAAASRREPSWGQPLATPWKPLQPPALWRDRMPDRAQNTTWPRVLCRRGTAGQRWAKKEKGKAPSVAGGAPEKIPVRDCQRTRNILGSPAQGGL